MEYEKPMLKLGEFLMLLQDNLEAIFFLEEDPKTGKTMELLPSIKCRDIPTTQSPVLRSLLDRPVEKFHGFGNQTWVWLGRERKSPFIMDDFPKKELLVVDILHYVDGKEDLVLVGADGAANVIRYEGRAEYLCYTGEGFMDELGTKRVSWFESGSRNGHPCTFVYLDEEEGE